MGSGSPKFVRNLLTPRRVAWVAVVSGALCFTWASPKTPLEFFDAAVRDKAAIRELERREDVMSATEGEAAFSRDSDEIASLREKMERIALLYDLAKNPQRVNTDEVSIVAGSYWIDESTAATLRATDASFGAVEQDMERCRARLESHERRPTMDGAQGTLKSTSRKAHSATFRMEQEAMLLRWFQAGLLWRKAT